MASSIVGKRILVTGGARGIGGESARYFASEGALVVTFDVRDDLGVHLAAEATDAGPGRVTYRHVDVTKLDDIFSGVAFAASELGGLDAVFNIAGVGLNAHAHEIPEDHWDTSFAVNVKGLAYVCQAAFPHLRENGGTITNFASDAALSEGPIPSAVYSATKGAVVSYSRTLAREWAPYGIRVNAVNPLVNTPLSEEVFAALSPEDRGPYERAVKRSVPLGGKLGEIATDLAPVLAFLASDDAKFITSQLIPVNGGAVSTR